MPLFPGVPRRPAATADPGQPRAAWAGSPLADHPAGSLLAQPQRGGSRVCWPGVSVCRDSAPCCRRSPQPDRTWPGRDVYNDLVLSDFVVDEEPSPGVVLALHRATHATLLALATSLAELDLPASEI